MRKLFFVGEGPNDRDVVPIIVAKITDEVVASEFLNWREIKGHGSSGFTRKIELAIFRALSNGSSGLVATLDADNHPKSRLADLKKGRENYRKRSSSRHLPVALGEAVPELEAWLLDDSNAVKQSLELDPEEKILSPERCQDVKKELGNLISKSNLGLGHADCLQRIANALDPNRCRNPRKTGLSSFIEEVGSEFGQTG